MTRRIITIGAAVVLGYLLARVAAEGPASAAAAYVRCYDGHGAEVWAGWCDAFEVAASPKRGEVVGRCTTGWGTEGVRKVRRCGVGR